MRRFAVAAATILAGGLARAAEPAPWVWRADVVGAANPPGLMAIGGLHRLFSRGEAGLAAGVSPAYPRLTAQAEWLPWPFLELSARGDGYRFLAQRDALLSFPSASSAFGDRERRALDGREEAAWGGRLILSPALRARWRRLIVVHRLEHARYSFGGRGPYVLELEYDALIRPRGHLTANRTVLLYAHRDAPRLYYGPFFEHQRAAGSRLERTRVGMVLDAVFRQRGSNGLKPRFYLAAGYNLEDRNRQDRLFFVGGVGVEIPARRGKNSR